MNFRSQINLAIGFFVLLFGCGTDEEFNLLKPISRDIELRASEEANLEEARVHLDEDEFDEALEVLTPLLHTGKDSNRVRMLYASAKLGQSGFDIWEVLEVYLEEAKENPGSNSQSGISQILDQITEGFLGSGAEREEKVDAFSDGLDKLLTAPSPDSPKIVGITCLFAGLLAIPVNEDMEDAVATTNLALDAIKNSQTDGGSNCPDIGQLDEGTTGIAQASAPFNQILEAAAKCTFLDLSGQAQDVNQVQQQLARLTAATDKGCADLPECPAINPNCHDLYPQCVQDALSVGSSSAVAGDELLDSCEIVLHCSTAAECF